MPSFDTQAPNAFILYGCSPDRSVYLWSTPLSRKLNWEKQSRKEWFQYSICATLDIRWVGTAFPSLQKLKMKYRNAEINISKSMKWILNAKIRIEYSIAMAWTMRLDVTASSRWMYICGVTRGGHPRTREAYGLPFCYTAQSQCLVGRVCTSHPASLPYQRSLSSRSWLRLVWRIRRGFTATQRWFRGGCSACVSPRVHVVHVWVRVCMYVRACASKLFRAFQCLCDLVLPSSHDRQLVGTENEQCGSVQAQAAAVYAKVYMGLWLRSNVCTRAYSWVCVCV